MKRLPMLVALVLCGFVLMGADGCSSDPNVEGAKLDLRNKDYDRALENLETALATNPDNADALELKGRVLSEMATTITDPMERADLLTQMSDAFSRAVTVNPELSETVTQSMRVAYYNEFNGGIQAFNVGQRDEDAEAFGRAAAAFGNAALVYPDSASAYVNQAYAYMNAGRGGDAIMPFEKAVELGDNSEETYRFLGSLYTENDRAGDAVTLLEGAMQELPGNPNIMAQLLNAYQMSDQMDRAERVYGDLVAAEPENTLYRFNYGTLLLQAEKYGEAIEQFSAAINSDPDYTNAQYNLGAAYINQAVEKTEEINAIDDDLRARRADLSQDQIDAMNAQIESLDGERASMFQQAIAPLEKAKMLTEAEGGEAGPICQALFQAYAQTKQTEKAQEIAECACYSDL